MDEDNASPSHSAAWSGIDLSAVGPARAEALRALMATTEALCAGEESAVDRPDGREAAAIAGVLAAVTSRLTAARVQLLPVVEADGLWALDGARSFGEWVARVQHLPIQAARAQAKLGRTLRDHLPLTAAAVTAGQITVDHAQVLARYGPTTEQRREILADAGHEVNEAFLVDQARDLPVDEFRTVCRHWTAYTDPDADDRGYVEACDREHLYLARVGDMYDLAGQLTIEHGQALKAALHAITPVPAAGDDRSAGQRRAQALADLAKVNLDQTGHKTARPRINVLVDYPTFAGLLDSARKRPTQGALDVDGPTRSPSFATAAMLTGEAIGGGPRYEDGTTICRAELDLIACLSDVTRTIFGTHSEVLDVGRAERCFTGPRRAALIARDKHCRYPGCTAPPIICDAHHLDEWVRDHGRTDVARGILICTWHHGYVHRNHIEIMPCGKRFIFTDRNGREITADDYRFLK